MLVLSDYRYKSIISNEYITYLVELSYLNKLLEKKLIELEIYDQIIEDLKKSHIRKK